MAGGNIVVTKTVNRTTFELDKGSYARTLKAIKSIKKEWEKAGQTITQPKNNPARAYNKAATEMRLVNKRLQETRRKEEAKTTAHNIAQAKKEMRAKEVMQKQSAARIRQAMQNMTASNPEAARMRKFYQEQQKAARIAERQAKRQNGPRGPLNIRSINSMQIPPRGGAGTGMVGNPNNISNPAVIARQNAAMAGQIRLESRIRDKARASSQAAQRREAANAARRDDVIGQQRIRLSSQYGDNYHQRLGRGGNGDGIQDLNNKFKAGTLSAGQYRQSIASLERQFRSAQGSASGFAGTLDSIKGALMGGGAAYGAFQAGASVLKNGQFFQGLEATMSLVSDTSEEAGKRIGFVREQAMRLGLPLKEAAQGYVQMSVSAGKALDKAGVDQLFKGYSEYATALQVDPVKYQRGITAIQQMLGKGQVMAEELKGQLAEAIPGSMDVFVRAAQEAFGDATIDVEKLFDMMKNGELTSAKLMPFISKYYSEAARKGGALDIALASNRVAMQRLQQTWVNFQNEVFQGGFGEQMTRIFNDLAQVLSDHGELATNIGKFFGNLIDGAWDAVTLVHNAFVFLDRVMGYYLEQWGYKGDLMKEIFNWGAYLLGIGLFIKSVTTLFNLLSKIAGLSGALAAVRGSLSAMGAAGAAAGGAGAAGGAAGGAGFVGPPRPPGGPRLTWSTAGKLGKLGLLGNLLTAGQVGYGEFVQRGDDKIAQNGNQPLPANMPKPVGLLDVFDEWINSSQVANAQDLKSLPSAPTYTPSGPTANPMGNPMMRPPAWMNEPLKVEVTTTVKDGEFKGIIQSEIKANDQRNFNLMTQGGPG